MKADHVEPGQVYERAGVVVVVLRRRGSPPESEGFQRGYGAVYAAWASARVWWDVLNVASETSLRFHTPGAVVAWDSTLFEERGCRRWV